MSATELKERLTEFVNTQDEGKLIRLWDAAEAIAAEEDVVYEHETPEFFAELDQIDADIDSGKERTLTRAEFEDLLYNRKPIP